MKGAGAEPSLEEAAKKEDLAVKCTGEVVKVMAGTEPPPTKAPPIKADAGNSNPNLTSSESLAEWNRIHADDNGKPPYKREASAIPRPRGKRARKICSHEGCTTQARKGGICIKHGAEQKRCSHYGCANAALNRGVCISHGAVRKSCNVEGCANKVNKGGVCVRHGAKVKKCKSEGCTNMVRKGGVCVRHGAKAKTCGHEDGCTNLAVKGGVCIRHGAKQTRKICSSDGCTNIAKKAGVCVRHGAKVKKCSHNECTISQCSRHEEAGFLLSLQKARPGAVIGI